LNVSLNTNLAMVPYFALGAFAGLRAGSDELSKLRWSDVHFDEKTIVVPAAIAKTDKRFIPLIDSLNAWLTIYLERCGRLQSRYIVTLPYGTLRKARRKIFDLVSPGQSWIPAGLRHSFASAMINSGKGIDATCLALGYHGNPKMLWDHYYLATSKEQAEAYWNIFP
jgi:integrase